MGGEISDCCSKIQAETKHELDKRFVKDFRYLSRHEGAMPQTDVLGNKNRMGIPSEEK